MMEIIQYARIKRVYLFSTDIKSVEYLVAPEAKAQPSINYLLKIVH